MDEITDANQIIDLLGLEPLPAEGGFWAQTEIDQYGSAIYYLMRPGHFSHLHRLSGPELWHFYLGDPVQMVLLGSDGSVDLPMLNASLAPGHRPQITVPAGTWMGAYSTGAWSLVGTTMAPAYDPESFELLDRATARANYPEAAEAIDQVTNSANEGELT